ncbi:MULTISPECIES: SDR family NAD(P)-dependent oxidoreductase [unclassified Pseudofrankia]|uniref:SDR family NAD(P)-dependent oxidoreductase n=1 Tax=unclassified Pseudofrankia TaxID=2994372 RepID=UPI0008DA4D40|nr:MULTISPECIES: SDR family NAD(P)-dependent oxidoreductase [unclassified Pseudofrankia]MDT3440868.1 SDR family NAD(P)-dependent oxidoreductase [Pseudofrankia sp. BMG5.37]OHV43709.1 short-chain dehydrogenase/reductase [Pseudofrankia sp. BMG5.36]
MAEPSTPAQPRSVVITGASRGLGLASAAHLYRQGWHVLAAMRAPDVGMARLREATGATLDDPRLTPVRLDLDDPTSISEAARMIEKAVGAPDAVVHNAALIVVGCVEEMPADVFRQIFATNVLGPVRLTQELLPAMRAAGRGRIVVVSSAGGVRGMPTTSAYSASKGALERWAEALAEEIAAFGLGVTVLVAGTFNTSLEQTFTYADRDGPYSEHHASLGRAGERVLRSVSPPENFPPGLTKALGDRAPFTRHAVGNDARMLLAGKRLMPDRIFRALVGKTLGLPRPGSLRDHPHRLATVTPPSDESERHG